MKLENTDNTLFTETVASSKSRDYFSLESWLKHARIDYRELLKFQLSWIHRGGIVQGGIFQTPYLNITCPIKYSNLIMKSVEKI